MAELRLAGNFINGTFIFGSYGHLQIVFVQDDGTELEIEVQSQRPESLLGKWQYPIIPRDHTNLSFTPNYGSETKYAYTTLDLGDRSAQSVWEILKETHEEFSLKGTHIDYDVHKNSNSYVTTLLSIIGIDVYDVIGGAWPTEVNEFPGAGVNVLNIEGDAFSLNLTGSAENDVFHGGIRNDEFTGNAGDDTFKGGRGDDFLKGGEGNDTYIVDFGDRGLDTIHDTDGLGVIKYGSLAIKGKSGVTDDEDWIKVGNSWIDQQHGYNYRLIDQGNTNDLFIGLGDGSDVRVNSV